MIHRAANKVARMLGYELRQLPTAQEKQQLPPSNHMEELAYLFPGEEELTLFDVGAHDGFTAGHFRAHFKKANIYCFEPFPEAFERLKPNTARDSRIHAFDYGLSNRDHIQDFHSNTFSMSNSLLATDERGHTVWGRNIMETKEVIQAKFKTLDTVMAELQLDRVDVLKMDVQGAEHLVLEGAAQTLREGRIRAIYAELMTQLSYVGQKTFSEMMKVYYDCGFELHNIFNLESDDTRKLRQMDIILTRKKAN